jgi:hypothetical protein
MPTNVDIAKTLNPWLKFNLLTSNDNILECKL